MNLSDSKSIEGPGPSKVGMKRQRDFLHRLTSASRFNSAPHEAKTNQPQKSQCTNMSKTTLRDASEDVGYKIKELQLQCEDFQQQMREIRDEMVSLEESKGENEDSAILCEKENSAKMVTLECVMMSHQDTSVVLDRELDNLSVETKRLIANRWAEQLKWQKLESGLADVTDRRADEINKMEKLEIIKKSQNWLAMAQLSLTSQMHSAAQVIKDYNQRTLKERAASETYRKKLHNGIQEIRGNIRVFCRFRPLIAKEIEEKLEESRYTINKYSTTVTIYSESRKNVTGHVDISETYDFTVERIFPSDASQHHVFAELAQLLQCALDGYNVCIFAYGQTGSGKTFTMEGSEEAARLLVLNPEAHLESHGMIPRAVHLIFDTMKDLKSKGWSYTAEVSILEIYNETVRDLLAEATYCNSTPLSNATSQPQCDIKIDAKGNVSAPNLKIFPVSDSEAVLRLLGAAAKNRASAATQCNDRSSRSHSVFQLTIMGNNSFTKESTKGVLSLIDLAGSERVEKSQVSGERLRETQNINKSLSSLGDVISALGSKKREHVPFRNSKLTMLLKDSLGGNSKTIMLVNLSPLRHHLSETINSLRFATKVNACTVGVAKRNAVIGKGS